MAEVMINMSQTTHEHEYDTIIPHPHPQVKFICLSGGGLAYQDCGGTHGEHETCKLGGGAEDFYAMSWNPNDAETENTFGYANNDAELYAESRVAIHLPRNHKHDYNCYSKKTEAYPAVTQYDETYTWWSCDVIDTVMSGCHFQSYGSETRRNYVGETAFSEKATQTHPRAAIAGFRQLHSHDYEYTTGSPHAWFIEGSYTLGLKTCKYGHTNCKVGQTEICTETYYYPGNPISDDTSSERA